MEIRQIEAWAVRVIEEIKRTGHQEDARVEVKSEWPANEARAARQIAALANAAPGSDLLWVIGVDDKLRERCVVGAQMKEGATWWPAVAKWFDGDPPHVTDVNVTTAEGTNVVALYFRSDRVPFVVQIPEHGRQGGPAASHEVPYRTMQRTNTATRSQLMRLLSPLALLPQAAPVTGSVTVQQFGPNGGAEKVTALMAFDIVPPSRERLSLRVSRCELHVEFGVDLPLVLSVYQLGVAPKWSDAKTDGWISLDGPETLQALGTCPLGAAVLPRTPLRLIARLFVGLDDRPVTVSLELHPVEAPDADGSRVWRGGREIVKRPSGYSSGSIHG